MSSHIRGWTLLPRNSGIIPSPFEKVQRNPKLSQPLKDCITFSLFSLGHLFPIPFPFQVQFQFVFQSSPAFSSTRKCQPRLKRYEFDSFSNLVPHTHKKCFYTYILNFVLFNFCDYADIFCCYCFLIRILDFIYSTALFS